MHNVFVLDPDNSLNLDYLPKKKWQLHYTNTSEMLLSYLYRSARKNIFIIIKLSCKDSTETIIEKIREYSLTPCVIVYETRHYYEKAYTYLKKGACYYLAGKIPKTQMKAQLEYLSANLLYPRKWLHAFHQDNVGSRHSLYSNKHLIGYKLNSLLKKKYSPNFIQSTLNKNGLPQNLDLHNSTNISKKNCLNIIEKTLRKKVSSLEAGEILFIGDPLTSNLSKIPYLRIKEMPSLNEDSLNKVPENSLLLCNLKLSDLPQDNATLQQITNHKMLYLLEKKDMNALNTLFRLGITDIYCFETKQNLIRLICDLWLFCKFPFFYNRVTIESLSFKQRLCFFEFIYFENKKTKKDFNQLDIFALFPEFIDDENGLSTECSLSQKIFTAKPELVTV